MTADREFEVPPELQAVIDPEVDPSAPRRID
jgi:hypothetical protein